MLFFIFSDVLIFTYVDVFSSIIKYHVISDTQNMKDYLKPSLVSRKFIQEPVSRLPDISTMITYVPRISIVNLVGILFVFCVLILLYNSENFIGTLDNRYNVVEPYNV